MVYQGDLIKLEGLSTVFFVASNNFFHTTEQAILCPASDNTFEDPLHIPIMTDGRKRIVMCEQLRLFDLHIRGYSKVGDCDIADIMNITDAIQSIFDY